MTDSRWQAFTQDEIDALVDALDHYITHHEHEALAETLYDEITALAAEDEADDG